MFLFPVCVCGEHKSDSLSKSSQTDVCGHVGLLLHSFSHSTDKPAIQVQSWGKWPWNQISMYTTNMGKISIHRHKSESSQNGLDNITGNVENEQLHNPKPRWQLKNVLWKKKNGPANIGKHSTKANVGFQSWLSPRIQRRYLFSIFQRSNATYSRVLSQISPHSTSIWQAMYTKKGHRNCVK